MINLKRQMKSSPLTKRMLVELGENLKLARLRRKLSVRVIADRVGVSVNTITSLEKGLPGVSIGVVANTLHALGLAEDIKFLAKDDEFGRKLQDLELIPRKKAPKKIKGEANEPS